MHVEKLETEAFKARFQCSYLIHEKLKRKLHKVTELLSDHKANVINAGADYEKSECKSFKENFNNFAFSLLLLLGLICYSVRVLLRWSYCNGVTPRITSVSKS